MDGSCKVGKGTASDYVSGDPMPMQGSVLEGLFKHNGPVLVSYRMKKEGVADESYRSAGGSARDQSAAAAKAVGFCCWRGMVKNTVVPLFGSLWIASAPPCSFTSAFASGRPRPVPWLWRE